MPTETATFTALANFSSLIGQSRAAAASLASVGTAAQGVGAKVGGAMSRFASYAPKMTSLGRSMTMGITLPLVGLGVAAVKTFADFDKTITQAAGKANATGKEFKAMRDLAIEMGEKTMFSAQQAADALDNLAALGFTAKQSMAALPGVMLAAQATGEDLALTADTVAKSINAFGLEAKDATHVADVFTSAVNNSALSMRGIADGMAYVGEMGARFNASLEDTIGWLSRLVDMGVPAASAGQAMRTAMTRLASPTDKARGVMEDLNIQLRDHKGNLKPIPDLLSELDQKLSKANPALQQYAQRNGMSAQAVEDMALKTMVGIESAKAIALAISDGKPIILDAQKDAKELGRIYKGLSETMGKKAAKAFMDAHTNLGKFKVTGADAVRVLGAINRESDGVAKTFADRLGKTTAAGIDRMMGSLETLAITLVRTVVPAVNELLDTLEGLFNKMSEFAKANPHVVELGVKLGAAAAAAGPLLWVIGKITGGLGKIGGFVAKGGLFGLTRVGAKGGLAGAAAKMGPTPVTVMNWPPALGGKTGKGVPAVVGGGGAAAATTKGVKGLFARLGTSFKANKGGAGLGLLMGLLTGGISPSRTWGGAAVTGGLGGALTGAMMGGPWGALLGGVGGLLASARGIGKRTYKRGSIEASIARLVQGKGAGRLDVLGRQTTGFWGTPKNFRSMMQKSQNPLFGLPSGGLGAFVAKNMPGVNFMQQIDKVDNSLAKFMKNTGSAKEAQKAYNAVLKESGLSAAAFAKAMPDATKALKETAKAEREAAAAARARQKAQAMRTLKAISPALAEEAKGATSADDVIRLAKAYKLLPDQVVTLVQATGAVKTMHDVEKVADAYKMTPQEVVTLVKASGIKPTFEDINRLADKYKMTPKTILTMIKQTGAELTARQVTDLATKYKMTPKELTTLVKQQGVQLSMSQIMSYAAKLNLTPKQVMTLFKTSGTKAAAVASDMLGRKYGMTAKDRDTLFKAITDRAWGKANHLFNKYKVADEDRLTVFKADVSDAISQINRLQAKISAVVGRRVVAGITGRTGRGAYPYMPKGLRGQARGGAVWGGGTETSDSILARLSKNEHVWTAREVRGAGGHGAVQRLRGLAAKGRLRGFLPGYAKGGAAGGGGYTVVINARANLDAKGFTAGMRVVNSLLRGAQTAARNFNKTMSGLKTSGVGKSLSGMIGPARAVAGAFRTMSNAIKGVSFAGFRRGMAGLPGVLGGVRGAIGSIPGVLGKMRSAFQSVPGPARSSMNATSAAANSTKGPMSSAAGAAQSMANRMRASFRAVGSGARAMASQVSSSAGSIRGSMSRIAGAYNRVASFFGARTLSGGGVAAARGGVVPGARGRSYDTVPAHLRVGEGVLVPEATQAMGGSKGVERYNRAAEKKKRGMPVKLATGGPVPGTGRWDANDAARAGVSGAWDYSVPTGTRVRSTTRGVVAYSGYAAGSYGNYVVVNSGGKSYYYAHLSSRAVSAGQRVRAGQVLGRSGSTGNSTGPHLHYEIRGGPRLGPGGPTLVPVPPPLPGWIKNVGKNPVGYLMNAYGHPYGPGAMAGLAMSMGRRLAQAGGPKLGAMIRAYLAKRRAAIRANRRARAAYASTGHIPNTAVVRQIRAIARRRGMSSGEIRALLEIVRRESGFDPNADNPKSSAAGLFQKLQSAHGRVESTVAGQTNWGINYIRNRYGSASNALAFWNRHGYYDKGGWLPPGTSVTTNRTGKPEAILTQRQWDVLAEGSTGWKKVQKQLAEQSRLLKSIIPSLALARAMADAEGGDERLSELDMTDYEWFSYLEKSRIEGTRAAAQWFANKGFQATNTPLTKSQREAMAATYNFELTVNNPVAERASDSAVKRLRRIATMGLTSSDAQATATRVVAGYGW